MDGRADGLYRVSHVDQTEAGRYATKVYSNCDAVELLLNGKSLGTKSKGETFLWDVPLTAGKNQLSAEATRDGKHVADALCIRCE